MLSSIVPLTAVTLRSVVHVPETFEESISILKELVGLSLSRFELLGRHVSLKDIYRRKRKFLVRVFHKTYGFTKNSYGTQDILKEICTQRDSKVVLCLRGICIMMQICFGFHPEITEDFLKDLFKLVYCEGTLDAITADFKKSVVIVCNRLTENRVQQCTVLPSNSTQETIVGYLDKYLDKMKLEGRMTDIDVFWYNSILSQTRILPLPSKTATSKKVVEYIKGLSKPYTVKDNLEVRQQWIPRNQFLNHEESSIVWEKDLYQGVNEVGKAIAQDICVNIQQEADRVSKTFKEIATKKKDYHSSFSSSSSFEYGRSEGGKWNTYTFGEFNEFMQKPIFENFTFDEGGWLDAYGKTVCSNDLAHHETWRVAYLDEPLCGVYGETITPGYLQEGVEAFAQGADARLGTLMFQWSTLKHKVFLEEYNIDNPSTYPKGKVSVVKEPGGKIRPVTSSETWLNVYLSPAAHTLRGFLESIPACRVGLSESNGLFRFSQEYKIEPSIDDFISTSDMTSATDRAAHETGFGLLNGLITELHSQGALTKGERDYLKSAAALLTTPKRLQLKTKGSEKRLINKSVLDSEIDGVFDGDCFYFSNMRGIMMGDPLTKIVLTLSSYGAWRVTVKSPWNDVRDFRLITTPSKIRNYSKVKAYTCAGDDHLGIGPEEDLIRIPKVMESMGYEISWDKYNINKKYVSYCQLFGMLPRYNPVSMAKGVKNTAERKFIQIDVPKLRLLTQFQKMGGKENFDKPDPMVGKSLQMSKDIMYMRETLELEKVKDDLGLSVYYARLRSFINLQSVYVRLLMPSWMEWKLITNVMTYLPPEFGGLGLTLPFDVSIRENAKAIECASRFSTKVEKPIFDDSVVEWERGVNVTNIVINKLVRAGLGRTLSEEETVDQAKEEIKSQSAAGTDISISNMKLWSFISSKYTCLDRNIPLVTSQENAYVTLLSHPTTKLQVTKKLRARQLLRKRQLDLIKYELKPSFDWSTPKAPRSYIKTEELREALQTGFVMPSLRVNTRLFENSFRKYPKWISNIESVREMTDTGSFDASIDESRVSVVADSSS